MSENRSYLKLVTPPTAEPVTLEAFKDHQRISHSDEDARLTGLLQAARAYCENYLSMAFVTQTWRQTYDRFPNYCDTTRNEMRIGRPPLVSVSSVTYTNSTGGTTTVASSDYRVDADARPGRITPAYGATWPTGINQQSAAVNVTFIAGFSSSTPEAVALTPAPIKQAILMMAGHLYENREAINVGNIVSEMPLGVAALLDSEQVGQYV